jgi:hypothetical protein
MSLPIHRQTKTPLRQNNMQPRCGGTGAGTRTPPHVVSHARGHSRVWSLLANGDGGSSNPMTYMAHAARQDVVARACSTPGSSKLSLK